MSRPSTWPFPAAEIHREATADPLDEARERILDIADEGRGDLPKPNRFCPTCHNYGGHSSGCPDDEDVEPDEDSEK